MCVFPAEVWTLNLAYASQVLYPRASRSAVGNGLIESESFVKYVSQETSVPGFLSPLLREQRRESVRTIFVLAVSLFLSNPWGRTQRRTQHKKAVGSEQVAQASEDERNVFPRASSYSRSHVLRSSARSPATRDWSQSKNDFALKRTQKGNVVVLKRYTNYPKSNYFIAIDAFRQ